MILSDEQIDYIALNLEHYGVREAGLREDLLDHICTHIEQGEYVDFEKAYRNALDIFGGQFGLFTLQQQTFYTVALQKSQFRRKVLYIAGFIATFLISSGAIFKMMHWPYAGVMLLSGFVVLNFAVLPVFFYDRYKNTQNTYSSIL